jgi:hypothetical protein
MTWTKKISRPVWIVLGVIVGLLLVPTVAIASSFVVIAGANHQNVNATADSQLLTTQAAPSSYEVAAIGKADTDGCFRVPSSLTKSNAFILTNAAVDVWSLTGSGPYINASIYNGPACGVKNLIGDDNPSTVGVTSLSFGPGFAVAKGKQLSVDFAGTISAEIYLYGYKVPAADVPASTPIVEGSGFDGLIRGVPHIRAGN